MSLLSILYWVILILSAIGVIAIPETSPNGRYVRGGAYLVLFIIIGLRVFRTSIQ